MSPLRRRCIPTGLLLLAGLVLAGSGAAAQELTPDQRAWLRGHASDPSIAGGWARRAAEASVRREALRSAGRLAGMGVTEAARAGAALAGTLNVLVLAVTYYDVTPPFPAQDLATALFARDGVGGVTVSEYFAEMSQGVLNITGEVTPWIVLESASSYYLPASEYRWPNRGLFSEWLSSVFRKADPLVDFGRFDNDGPDGVPNSGDDDGVVDLLWIMYATDCRGEWRNGFIWPGGGQLNYWSDDAAAGGGTIHVGPAVFMNAQRNAVCAPVYSGMLAHETGHAFGLPDLYDYDFSSNGVGYWDLMGYGLYNSEASPAYLGAYSRERLGWIAVNDLRAADSTVRVEPTERAHVAYRHALAGSNEYFLLENRQPLGTDARLPGPGLLIWHVDRSAPNNDDEFHKHVDVEEADGLASLDSRRNYGDTGDPFPGSAGKTRFGAETEPNSRLYTGAVSNFAIDAIALRADSSVSFGVVRGLIAITTDSLRTATMGTAYEERLAVETALGPVTWQVVAGSPPPGVGVAFFSGTVNGVPESAGQFSFTVQAQAGDIAARRTYTLRVATPTLSFDSVVAHLMGTAQPLTPDDIRFLDLLGNRNGRFDLGDFVAWLDATGFAARGAAARPVP